jgi:probable rRNA maturation factor
MPSAVRVQLGAALGERAAASGRPAAAAGSASDAVPDAAVRRVMGRAARAALRHGQVRNAELSITLLDDVEIADMNREFLSHEGVTDVISFALYGADEDPVGDIYIGFDQALRQAGANGVDAAEELARLAVHGTLHVLGHDHPDGADRLRSEMWLLQESIVAQVFAS